MTHLPSPAPAFPPDFAKQVIAKGLEQRRQRRVRIGAVATVVLVASGFSALWLGAAVPPAQPAQAAATPTISQPSSRLSGTRDEGELAQASAPGESFMGGRSSLTE